MTQFQYVGKKKVKAISEPVGISIHFSRCLLAWGFAAVIRDRCSTKWPTSLDFNIKLASDESDLPGSIRMARNMNWNVRIATSDPMEDTKIIPIFEGCNILIATPRRLWEFVYDRKWDEFKNVRLVTSNKRPEYRSSTKSHRLWGGNGRRERFRCGTGKINSPSRNFIGYPKWAYRDF